MGLFDSPVKPFLIRVASPVQVVAGTNYKLLLDIANSQNKKERLEAVVYGEVLCKHAGILNRPEAGLGFLLSIGECIL